VVISESEITRQPELSEDLAFSSCLAEWPNKAKAAFCYSCSFLLV
jgi:hypothetical protein